MSRHALIPIVVAAALLTTAATVEAETVHVYAGEPIQAAIDGCFPGDEIIVHPGTYNEAIDFLGKGIWLHSSDGPEATIIDATGLGSSVITCINGEGPGTVLEGFTITGGSAMEGGGMCNADANPTVTSCTFTGNWSGGDGGGVFNSLSSPTLTNCTFSDNGAQGGGGGMFSQSSSSPTVTNCTFSGNTATSGGGIFAGYASHTTVVNSIVWGETGGAIGGDATVTYSDIEGGYAGAGNIDADPLFVDPGAGSFRLCDYSPCTDAGNNNAVPPEVTTDLDGNPRRVDDGGVEDCGLGDPPIVDMGAYERQSDSGPIQVPGDYATIQAAIDAACVAGNEIIVAAGTYSEAIDFSGKAIWLHSSDGPEVTIIDATGLGGSVVLCVSSEGPDTILEGFTITGGSGGGMFNDNASPTVTNCTFSGNTATCGGGMYNYGNASPTVTNCTFSANTANWWVGYGGGMYNYYASPTVANCTFSENQAYNGGGMHNYYASPTVTNCTFSANTANWVGGYGGGMCNYDNASPTVTNCILWGDAGGEICHDGSSTPIVTYSDVQGGTGQPWFGAGCIDADPLFVDPGAGSFRLCDYSPCTDAGDNNAVPPEVTTDLDGNPRRVDDGGVEDCGLGDPPIVDMGAYERQLDSGEPIQVPGDYATIQAAIDAATWCKNEIVVAAGTYSEAIDFSGKAIWLHSSDGPEATTIDATASGQVSVVTCVSGEGPDTILEGFTITGGSGTDPGDGYRRGGGMRNQGSSPTVTNCTFTANSAYFGGGMYNLDNASPTVTNCTFSGNTASFRGGGMFNWGDYVAGSASPTVTDCTFSANTATDCGGGMFNYIASPTLTNCAFGGNAATQGGAVYSRSDSYPMLVGCTFTNNTASDLGGALYNEAYGIPTVANCILWGDAGGEICHDGSSTPIVTYSDVQGGTGQPWFGAGCIDADPLFVDPGAGSFRLCDYSPCTDAGNNNAVPPEVTTDLDGNPRRVDDGGVEDCGLGDAPIVDMGACERQLDSGEPIQVPGDYATIQAAIDAACVAGNEIIVAAGTYSEAIDFSGKAIWLHSSDGPEVTIIDATGLGGSVVLCVSSEGPDTVLEGFTITGGSATSGGGMFNDNASPTVTNCTFSANYGGNGGGGMLNYGASPTVTNCTFSANYGGYGGGGMCNYDNASPTVTNCTFSGNTANWWVGGYGGGMYNYYASPTVANCTFSGNTTIIGYGGGMYNDNSSPTLANCTFSGNMAGYNGGGMYNYYASPTVANCTFSGNTASYDGGGMYNDNSSPTVANCTFSENQAADGYGGGMYNSYASPTVANCTFSGNTATYAGGMYNYCGGPTVTNCILWGDAPNEIEGSTAIVTYCDVQGGTGEPWFGAGCIDADPLFVDPNQADYHLSAGSPCIDAADNTAVPADTADLDGDGDTTERTPLDLNALPRFVNDPGTADTGVADPPGYPQVVDMGAYEFGIPCDLDGDCDVDLSDLAQLLAHYGTTSGASYSDGDVDGDGDVQLADLAALLAVYNTTCP